jgi:hypothetical protein
MKQHRLAGLPTLQRHPRNFRKAPFVPRSHGEAPCHRRGRDDEVMRIYGGSFECKLRGQSGMDTGSHQIK